MEEMVKKAIIYNTKIDEEKGGRKNRLEKKKRKSKELSTLK